MSSTIDKHHISCKLTNYYYLATFIYSNLDGERGETLNFEVEREREREREREATKTQDIVSIVNFHRFASMVTTPSWYTVTHSPIHPTDVPSVSLDAVINLVQLFALALTDVTPYSPTVFCP